MTRDEAWETVRGRLRGIESTLRQWNRSEHEEGKLHLTTNVLAWMDDLDRQVEQGT